jgi:hypothetical protein
MDFSWCLSVFVVKKELFKHQDTKLALERSVDDRKGGFP